MVLRASVAVCLGLSTPGLHSPPSLHNNSWCRTWRDAISCTAVTAGVASGLGSACKAAQWHGYYRFLLPVWSGTHTPLNVTLCIFTGQQIDRSSAKILFHASTIRQIEQQNESFGWEGLVQGELQDKLLVIYQLLIAWDILYSWFSCTACWLKWFAHLLSGISLNLYEHRSMYI